MNYFETWLNTHKPETRRAYENDIKVLASIYEKQPNEIYSIERGALRQGIHDYISQNSEATATTSRRISSLKSFFRFLVDEGVVAEIPILGIRTKRVRNAPQEYLEPEEVAKILQAVDISEFFGKRDYIIISLAAELGLRRNEIVSLMHSNIKSSEGQYYLSFYGKRDKFANLPITQTLYDLIMEIRPEEGDGPLVPNRFGDNMSTHYVYKIVQRYAKCAGIRKKISPHSFRHYAITEAAKVEDNILNLMAFSRHENVKTLQRYTHVKQMGAVANIQKKRGIV